MAFKRMSKMKTTEPSVDEVGKGMKHGGKTEMADGGVPMGALQAAAAASMPRGRRPTPSRKPDPRAALLEAAMAQRTEAAPMMRKKGGKAEGDAEAKMDKAQDKALISKAFKQHDTQEHKGGKGTKLKLQTGGVPKYAAGGVVNGYKDGGHAKMSCSSGSGYAAMKKGGSF